jgi:DNA polymerase-3 subunit delta'
MSLSDVIGQEKAVAMLSGILRRQRVASSYLFCGESGIGKKAAAINFVKALNCLNTAVGNQESGETKNSKKEDSHFTPHSSHPTSPDACDGCESCLKIEAGTHPDFLLVSPEERQIRIEEIRAVDEALSFKPFEGRKKAVVVDDAEAMNISAANAFLKTLEEPPEDSVIILVSSKPDLLPATIRSRCSRINFVPLTTDLSMRVIGLTIEGQESLELVARLSMGRPGYALSFDLAEERSWFLDLFKGMLGAEKDGWTSRDDMERWFDQGLIFFRDLAVLTITGDPARLINRDLRDYIAGFSKSLDIKVIIYIHQEFSRLRRLLLFNLNKSITWNYTASLLRKELAG